MKDLDSMIIAEVKRIHDQIMAMRKNDDYAVDPQQMDKFLDLVAFFSKRLGDKPTASVDVEKIEPKRQSGSVVAKFVLFDVHGDQVAEFCRVLSACSVIQVMYNAGRAIISCTVPNVFVRKEE